MNFVETLNVPSEILNQNFTSSNRYKRGVNRPTDRRLLEKFCPDFRFSARNFERFSDLVIPADCGFTLLSDPDHGILPVIKFGSRIDLADLVRITEFSNLRDEY